jgi:hypothetical protein
MLLHYRKLKDYLASSMVGQWKSMREKALPEAVRENLKKKKRDPSHLPKKIRAWALVGFGRSLGAVLYPEWKRLVDSCNPNVVAVMKKFIAVRGPNNVPRILLDQRLYADKHLVQDLLTYNAPHYCLD